MADQKLLKLVGTLALKKIKTRIRNNKVKPTTPKKTGKTLIQSAKLLNSLNKKVHADRVVLGSSLKYARIHHEGGIIKPRKSKYLAIPLTPAAKAKSPRDFEGTFIAKNCIMKKIDGKIVALYVLKKRVKIPARPFMFLNTNDKNSIIDCVAGYYRDKLRR